MKRKNLEKFPRVTAEDRRPKGVKAIVAKTKTTPGRVTEAVYDAYTKVKRPKLTKAERKSYSELGSAILKYKDAKGANVRMKKYNLDRLSDGDKAEAAKTRKAASKALPSVPVGKKRKYR